MRKDAILNSKWIIYSILIKPSGNDYNGMFDSNQWWKYVKCEIILFTHIKQLYINIPALNIASI